MNQKTYNKSESAQIEKTGRRGFLSKIWKLLGLIALAELAFFIVSMLRPGKKTLNSNIQSSIKVAGSVEDFHNNSVTPDRVNKFFMVRADDGGFLALSLTCSHLGCSVLWDQTKDQFLCPCHSSAFDKVGTVINSPAPRPLDYYPVEIEAGKVKVNISMKLKRKKFDKTQVMYAI